MKLIKAVRIALYLVTVLGAVIPEVLYAQAPDSGVWIWGSDISISLVNLTDTELLVENHVGSFGVTEPFQCCTTTNGAYQINIPAFRSATWMTPMQSPGLLQGGLVFTFINPDFTAPTFIVQFDPMGAKTEGQGFWTWLTPLDVTTGFWYHLAYAGWGAPGVWTTPVLNDYNMHNIMTISGRTVYGVDISVSYYSLDNRDLVLVVRRNPPLRADVSVQDTYEGQKLDFVDNGGRSVPAP